MIECPQLRYLFRLLRKGLQDADIPGRTKIRDRIIAIFKEYLADLEKQMGVSHQYVSFDTLSI